MTIAGQFYGGIMNKKWKTALAKHIDQSTDTTVEKIDKFFVFRYADVWTIEDVQTIAKEDYNIDLSDGDAMCVLNRAMDKRESKYNPWCDVISDEICKFHS